LQWNIQEQFQKHPEFPDHQKPVDKHQDTGGRKTTAHIPHCQVAIYTHPCNTSIQDTEDPFPGGEYLF